MCVRAAQQGRILSELHHADRALIVFVHVVNRRRCQASQVRKVPSGRALVFVRTNDRCVHAHASDRMHRLKFTAFHIHTY